MFRAFLLGFLCAFLCLVFTDVLLPDYRYPTDKELNWATIVPLQKQTYKQEDDTRVTLRAKFRPFLAGRSQRFDFVLSKRPYTIHSGIPSETIRLTQLPIIIYQAGYCKSNTTTPSSVCQALLKTDVCSNQIIITVECPFDSFLHYRCFNFAQDQDQYSIRRTIQRVHEINPNVPIVLFGASKGALNVARTVSNADLSPYNIGGVILESPPLSMERSVQNFFGGGFIQWVAPHIMPSYNPRYPILYDIDSFPQLPLLIAGIETDNVSELPDVNRFVQRLITIGVPETNITRYVHTEGKVIHGRLGKDLRYQQVVRDFLQQCTIKSV